MFGQWIVGMMSPSFQDRPAVDRSLIVVVTCSERSRICAGNADELIALDLMDCDGIGLSQPSRTFHDGLKDSPEVSRRRRDDPQHLGSGGLLLAQGGNLGH